MTTPAMDVLDVIRKRAEGQDVDFPRETLAVVLRAVMDADVAQQIGAELHEHTPDRAAYPPVLLRKRGEGQHLVCGVGEHRRRVREARLQLLSLRLTGANLRQFV